MQRGSTCGSVKSIGVPFAAVALWLIALAHGSFTGAAEPIDLRAGPLSMKFDAENAFLRYIKVGKYEILRGVNAPVRDRNWGTVLPKVSNVRVDNQGDHFSVDFDAVCKQNDIDLRWHGTIVGTREGEVEFTFSGEAHSTFLRNRIGMCILHPATAAGKPWIIRHVDGVESRGQFPAQISPHQPAKQIRGISHEVAEKLWAHIEMQGEVFEMEDQRNWTDASFKTYCTPLEIPYPVEVKSGTKIKHSVRIRAEGDVAAANTEKPPSAEEPIVLTLGERTEKLPRIGLQVSSEAKELSKRQLARLNELRLDHLRVDLQLSSVDFIAKLREASSQSRALGIPLHVGIHLAEQPKNELQQLVEEIKTLTPNVSAFIVYLTDWNQFEPARAVLLPVSGKASIGAARGDNFVDLNRDRPSGTGGDAIALPMNPQIHAFDDMSLVETLSIQGDAVRSAQAFLDKRKLVVGPVTLRPPLAKPSGEQDPPAEPSAQVLPPDVDARQSQQFAAAWTLGSVKYLAEAGASSVTYFETVGRKGVMGLDPELGTAKEKAALWIPVFPVYHLFREVADFAEGDVGSIESSNSLVAVGLTLQKKGETRVLVANLTGRQRAVAVKGMRSPGKVRLLDDRRAKPGAATVNIARDTGNGELMLNLPPHAIVRIDVSNDRPRQQ